MRHAIVKVVLGSLLLCATLLGARAEDYPTRPIRLIANYPAGGVVDLTARVIGQRLGEILGQQIVIDNRPGASTTLGSNMVAKATPDGYTLLVATTSTLSVIPAVMKTPYDTMKDLVGAAAALTPGNLEKTLADPAFTAEERTKIRALAAIP